MSPAVITSKAAQQDITNIKAQHADLMGAIDMHQLKVQAYKQQKDEEMKNQQVMMQEMQKEQMAQQTEATKLATQTQAQAQKDMLQHQQKMAELDIKRQALSQP